MFFPFFFSVHLPFPNTTTRLNGIIREEEEEEEEGGLTLSLPYLVKLWPFHPPTQSKQSPLLPKSTRQIIKNDALTPEETQVRFLNLSVIFFSSLCVREMSVSWQAKTLGCSHLFKFSLCTTYSRRKLQEARMLLLLNDLMCGGERVFGRSCSILSFSDIFLRSSFPPLFSLPNCPLLHLWFHGENNVFLLPQFRQLLLRCKVFLLPKKNSNFRLFCLYSGEQETRRPVFN